MLFLLLLRIGPVSVDEFLLSTLLIKSTENIFGFQKGMIFMKTHIHDNTIKKRECICYSELGVYLSKNSLRVRR